MQHSRADCGTRDGDAPDHRRTFDVFFSYNSRDRADVERIARHLARRDLEVWFDEWALVPGARFSDGIAHGLLHSAACAVFIGPNDLGAWTREEVSVAVNRAATEQNFRLFPVLLPGSEPFEPADLPPFLATRTWIDLREGPDTERGLHSLTHAVLGLPAGSGVPEDLPEAPCPYRGLESFGEADARFYFGRESYVQRLLEKLKQAPFVAVVGPSGSGKSSLIRAGLLPRLRAGGERWRILVRVRAPIPSPR